MLPSFLVLSTEAASSKFGFIRYGEEVTNLPLASDLSPLSPPISLVQIFSLARGIGTDFLVEEWLPCSSIDYEELEDIKAANDGLEEIERHNCKITFFRFLEETHKSAAPFKTNRREAQKQSQSDKRSLLNFLKNQGQEIECIGFCLLTVDVGRLGEQDAKPAAFVRNSVMKELIPENRCSAKDAFSQAVTFQYIHSKAVFETEVLGVSCRVLGSQLCGPEGSISCCGHVSTQVCLLNLCKALKKPLKICNSIRSMNAHLGRIKNLKTIRLGLSSKEQMDLFAAEDFQTIAFATHTTVEDEKRQLHTKYINAQNEYLRNPDPPPRGSFKVEGMATDAYVQFLEGRSSHILALAYQAIESGLPAILCFKGLKSWHAVTIVGHTFNPGLWSTRAYDEYLKAREKRSLTLSSMEWVDGFIIMDGNFGPYKVLSRRFLQHHLLKVIVPCFPWARSLLSLQTEGTKAEQEPPTGSLDLGDAWKIPAQTLAEKVLRKPNLNEKETEDIVSLLQKEGVKDPRNFTYLDVMFWLSQQQNPNFTQNLFWFHELRKHLREGRCVLRTTPCTLTDYVSFLRHAQVFHDCLPGEEEWLAGIEKHVKARCFWLVEISVRELYEWNKHRLGELIVCEDGKDQGLQPVFLRVPGFVDFPGEDGLPKPVGATYHYPVSRIRPEKLPALFYS